MVIGHPQQYTQDQSSAVVPLSLEPGSDGTSSSSSSDLEGSYSSNQPRPAKQVYYPGSIPLIPTLQSNKKCRIEYETIPSTQCKTVYEKSCITESRTKYATEFDKECQTLPVVRCQQGSKTVPDKKCSTTYEKICTKETKESYDIEYRDECQDIVKKVIIIIIIIRQCKDRNFDLQVELDEYFFCKLKNWGILELLFILISISMF